MSFEKLPYIFVDISQPGDKGNFLVRTSDGTTKELIIETRLKEQISYFEYIYTSRLIEGNHNPRGISPSQERERQADLIRYGQRLYNDLFGSDNRFKRHLQRSQHLKNGAKLVLRLHSTASELWNIPWEYVHNGEHFLGLQPQYTILRFLNDIRLTRTIPTSALPPMLRLLFVISNPRNVPQLHVNAEISMIRSAIHKAGGAISIDFVEQGTLENVRRALTAREYHALHYSGHGAINAAGSFLVMENDEGMAHPAFLSELLPLVEGAPHLRFIFLSACKTGNINETTASSGIAAGLMKAVPAVLAMQFSIRDDRASRFAEAFYGNIAKGDSLEQATHSARAALHTTESAAGDWGVPSLYLQRPNMRLVATGSSPQTVDTAPPTMVPQIPPPILHQMPQSRASAETTTQSAPTVHGLERLAHADIFSGRRDEQRTLRSYLAERKGLVYVWGIAGIGKSALVRHVLERPGTELSIDGVLVIPGSTPPQALYSTFARFVAEQFPAAVPHLKRLMTAPRESITALNSIVQGKQLVVVIDGLDAHMQPGTHYHWEFTNPQLRELFTALTAAKWSLTVVVTSRFRWEYLLTMPLEHQAEIVLHGLQPQECAFIFQSFDSVVKANKIDRIDVPQLFNLISGHPRTLSDMLRQLEANPQRFASTDMETMLANYWKSSFVDDVLRYLKPTEREALDVMSIHRAPFKPEHAQNLIGASALGDTEAIVTVWEALSLAQFLDTDEEDTPWYIIPKYISVPISSTISEQRKPLLHRKVAQSIELSFYRTLYDEDDAQQPLLSVVLERLGELFDQAHPQLVDHYVNLAYQWQEHYRKAGDTVQADQIALALLPPLSMFGRNEQMTELSNAILQSATKDESSILWAKYWQAVVALREKQYDTAFKMFSELSEKSKGRTELQLLYARSLERQGTILRAQTKRKDAILRWKEAARACVQNKDMTGLGRALSYLIQTHFHAGEYPESVEYIKQGFTAYKSWRMTSEDYMILGEMMIYRAHIYRHTGNDVEALKHYNEAYHIGKENGAGFLIGQALEHTAHVYMLLRQYELAAQILLSAVDVYERMESNADLSMALTKLAVVQDFRGNPKDALGHAERAFRLAQEHLPTNVDQTTKLIQNLKRKAR